MRKFTITDEPNQQFTIPFEGESIVINIKFLTVVSSWVIDITYKDEKIVSGIKVSAGVLMLEQFNKPFDILFTDDAGVGTDPFAINNFTDGLYSFYLFEREDLITVRGYDVE